MGTGTAAVGSTGILIPAYTGTAVIRVGNYSGIFFTGTTGTSAVLRVGNYSGFGSANLVAVSRRCYQQARRPFLLCKKIGS